MKAEIVSIGTELLLGSITDTNAAYLAQRLADLGIDCYYISQVGDNQDRIVETLRRAVGRSDLTITTGGLGPTGDDLTREAIASLLGEVPFVVPELEEGLRSFFSRRGVQMPAQNLKQATLIPSAQTLKNPVGTAPGWLVTTTKASEERHIVSMPGVPFEMKRMWQEEVDPWLRPQCPEVLVSRTLKILGLGESSVEERVIDLMSGANPTLAPYAKADGINLRISAKAASRQIALDMIQPVEAEIRLRLGDAVYGADDDNPAAVVIQLLTRSHIRLALLEIGGGAVGALSRPLSGYQGLACGLSGRSLSDICLILGGMDGHDDLRHISSTFLSRSDSQLVVAVAVTKQPGASADSLGVIAEVLITTSTECGAHGDEATRYAWNTTESEVSRLVGLNALNLLRKWLLDCEHTNE